MNTTEENRRVSEFHKRWDGMPDFLDLKPSEVFKYLSLPDILGRRTHPFGEMISIDDVSGRNVLSTDQAIRTAELIRLQNMHGIKRIGSYGGGNGKYEITAAPDPELSWWCPSFPERQLLIRLALAVTEAKNKPLIFDAGCGTGFIAKILGESEIVGVHGVDSNRDLLTVVPQTQGDVILECNDVFGAMWGLRPTFDEVTDTEIVHRLEIIESWLRRLQDRPFTNQGETDYRQSLRAVKRAHKELQGLLAGSIREESPVDLAFCSFMAEHTDFTAAMRDGIHPKCLMYVRPLNGKSGLDKLNHDVGRSELFDNHILSYDPGVHYRTICRWPTFNKLMWDAYTADIYGDFSAIAGYYAAEVVVQLRNDVVLEKTPDIQCERYIFDEEIDDVLDITGISDTFSGEFCKAKTLLFRS